MELWRPCLGFERFYEVSSYGTVVSLPRVWRNGNGGLQQKERTVLKPGIRRYGHSVVSLTGSDKIVHQIYVHRLVAQTYHEFIPGGASLNNLSFDFDRSFYPIVAHRVEDVPLNNSVENLWWTNKGGNTRDMISKGRNLRQTRSSKYIGVCYVSGKRCWRAALTVDGIKYFLGYFVDQEIAARYYDNFVIKHSLDRPLNFSTGKQH